MVLRHHGHARHAEKSAVGAPFDRPEAPSATIDAGARTRCHRVALLATALSLSAHALAEQKHGVEVYPNAKADAKVAKQLEKMNIKGAGTYRSGDSVAKVTEFYRKQSGLKEVGTGNAQGATFQGKDVMVTIQNPWLDMDTSQKVNDTLISIVGKKR